MVGAGGTWEQNEQWCGRVLDRRRARPWENSFSDVPSAHGKIDRGQRASPFRGLVCDIRVFLSDRCRVVCCLVFIVPPEPGVSGGYRPRNRPKPNSMAYAFPFFFKEKNLYRRRVPLIVWHRNSYALSAMINPAVLWDMYRTQS